MTDGHTPFSPTQNATLEQFDQEIERLSQIDTTNMEYNERIQHNVLLSGMSFIRFMRFPKSTAIVLKGQQ